MTNISLNKWLKRIFSIQSLSLITSVFAAYYTYKTYLQNEPGELTTSIYELTDENIDERYVFKQHDVNDYTCFYSLHISDCPLVQLNYNKGIPMGNVLEVPVIWNATEKTLKNLECKIFVACDDAIKSILTDTLNLRFRFNDLKVIFQNDNQIQFETLFEQLPPGYELPKPFKAFLLPSTELFMQEGGKFRIQYEVTYDGIKAPKVFTYDCRIYLNEENNEITDEKLKKFLSNDVYKYSYAQEEKGRWGLLLNEHFIEDIKQFKEREYQSFHWSSISDLQN